MHRFPRVFWVLACAALALPAFVPAHLPGQSVDMLTGRVTGPGGAPIASARVEVMSVELETTRSVLTDQNGRYMLTFPDGGGVYMMRVSYIGMSDVIIPAMRQGDEELILVDVPMEAQAIAMDGIEVRIRGGGAPGDGDAGEQSTMLSQELLNRLPLPDLDPSTVALLAQGVIGTELDSISGRMGFSVGGMSELLNQVTLDGILIGDSGLEMPEEGVRTTQVTTNTFDASRGGFAGGQVAMTSARGSNRRGGSFSYQLDNDALQMSSAAAADGFTRQNFGGSWGGPMIENRLFYNASFQLRRNTNHRFALAADDPLAAQRSGVALDSISRFLDILEGGYGIPTLGKTGPYNQVSDDLRLSGRLDWNIVQRAETSHSLATRVNLNMAGQDSTRISALDLSERGGETDRNTRMVSFTLNSRLGRRWTNALSTSYSRSWNDAVPFTEMPEGRVRVTSEWDDGLRDTRTLTFGGNRNMPTEARSNDFQLSNEVSLLQPLGSHIHRFKLGGSIQRQSSYNRSTDNLFGSFSYASLTDFEQNLPDRYERSLTERESRTDRLNTGLFISDTWRVSQPLEVTMGLRWDYSALQERPEHNPAVEDAFGRRTDVRPAASGFSPRVGFSYRLGQASIPRMATSVTGGIGVFAGRAPVNVFNQAYRQTGLPSAEQRLICIGEAVPIPGWDLYLLDPTTVPTECADGGSGVPPAFSTRAPNVTLVSPDQRLPSSVRADLGYRTTVLDLLPVNLRYTYSRGIGLWGYRDINLDESSYVMLGGEDRPFFGDPTAIVTRSGAVSSGSSRIDPAFGNVYEVVSNLGSSSHQVSTQLMGGLSENTTFMANYTLGFARDEGTAGGGIGRFGGGGGGMIPPTAGSPNDREWAVSSNDRRHTLNLTLTRAFTPEIEVALMGRVQSGTPFTPMVNRDISGDGLRNNRAFVFDPATAADPAVAEGMEALLGAAPSRILDCLESQLGQIAGRNSCRNGWTQSLNMRLSLRPNLPQLERRMTISLDATNVLTGLDQLFNGRDNMRGWGDGARADANLLYVRGFDPSTNSFRYEVNESFGQTRRGVNALRNPFAVRISGRVALGGTPARNNRGFGGGIGGAGMMGARGMGGMGAIGALRGGGGGGAAFGGGGSGGGALGGLAATILRGGVLEADSIMEAMFPNPVRAVLEMEEELGLSIPQRQTLVVVADSLELRLEERRGAARPAIEELASEVGSVSRGRGMPNIAALQGVQERIQPEVDAAQTETSVALERVREALTAEQWEQLPETVRNPGAGLTRRAAGGGFNAVGALDRMLANPIPVLLELRDTLALSAEQVERVGAVSRELQAYLDERREELGGRFDGVPAMRQAQTFQEIQPEIERSREEVRRALARVQEILTPEQWEMVPPQVRDPFQGTGRGGGPGMGGRRGPGAGGPGGGPGSGG